jgi:hypothetical protein
MGPVPGAKPELGDLDALGAGGSLGGLHALHVGLLLLGGLDPLRVRDAHLRVHVLDARGLLHQRIDLDLVVRGLREGDLRDGEECDRERGHAGTDCLSDHLLPSHLDSPHAAGVPHASSAKSRDKLPQWQWYGGDTFECHPR